MYYEPGMAYCGVWEDGNDDYYDLSEMNSQEVEDSIPSELDEAFGISETMREYEAEEQEELTQWIKDGADKKAQLIAE
jgi:hypothetical protein